MFLHENTRKHSFRGNISKFVGKHFAHWEENFVSATMFLEAGKQGNIDGKICFRNNVS